MRLTLTGGELELAVEEYLIARGLREGGTYDIRIIGGRAGNKSTATVDVTFERQEPIKQISTVYSETSTKEPETNPYEEEPEVVPDTVVKPSSPFATFSKIKEPAEEIEEKEEPLAEVKPLPTNLFK